jgi:hypothetical protein
MMGDISTLPAPIGGEAPPARVSPIAQLAASPEEVMAAAAKERANPARLPTGRAAFHGGARDRHGRRAAPGR